MCGLFAIHQIEILGYHRVLINFPKYKFHPMKKLFRLVFIFSNFHLFAQNKIPLLKAANTIKPDIEKVARDYYDHFYNIKGEKISETESTIEYQSSVVPKEALESTITEIKGLNNVYSWHATILNTEDYEMAIEKYKQMYTQLNGANFIVQGNKACKFKGIYDTPDISGAFASSILEPEVNEKVLQRLKIEVALNYNMPEWTVTIFVYEKENDADIRPTEKTDQKITGSK